MGGYRDDKNLVRVDPFTWGYQSIRLGFGLVAIAFGLLFTGHFIAAAITFLIGMPMLRYGMRNP